MHLKVACKLLLFMLKLPYQAGTLIGLPGTNSSALGVSLPVEDNTDKNFKLVLQWGLHPASSLAVTLLQSGIVRSWWNDGNPASHFQKRKSKGLHNMIWFREGWLWERNSRSFRAWADAVSWRAHSLMPIKGCSKGSPCPSCRGSNRPSKTPVKSQRSLQQYCNQILRVELAKYRDRSLARKVSSWQRWVQPTSFSFGTYSFNLLPQCLARAQSSSLCHLLGPPRIQNFESNKSLLLYQLSLCHSVTAAEHRLNYPVHHQWCSNNMLSIMWWTLLPQNACVPTPQYLWRWEYLRKGLKRNN